MTIHTKETSSKNKIDKITFTSAQCKWLVFLLAFLPRAVLCIFAYPFAVPSDEMATSAGLSLLNGSMSWSSVVAKAGYYGTGMSLLLSPLTWITQNPVILYRALTLFCVFLQSVTAPICYHLLEKYFQIKEKKYLMVISLVSSYFVVTRALNVYNEHGLILISWLTAWLLLKLQDVIDSRKKKAFYTVVLMIVLGYALTLHTRALTFWIALGIVIVFYGWTFRKSLVSFPVLGVMGVAAYVVAQAYTKIVQGHLWFAESNHIRNASLPAVSKAQELLNPDNWHAWANIIIGQIHTIGVFSCGVFLLAIVVFVHLMWKGLVRNKALVEQQNEEYVVERKLFPIIVFFFACVAMTILAQSISWLSGSVDVINQGYYSNLYGTKAYGYVRYFGPYCGPIVMSIFVYMVRCRKKTLRYMKPTLGFMAALEFGWLACVVPYLVHTDLRAALEFYTPFSFGDGTKIHLGFILPASIVMFVGFVLLWICLDKSKQWIYAMVVTVVLVYLYVFLTVKWELPVMRENFKSYSGGYELIQSLEDQMDIPRDLFVEDCRGLTDHQSWFGYQFCLNQYIIWGEIPESKLDEAIVFSNNVKWNPDLWTNDAGDYSWWLDEGYEYYVIDENEVMFVKGKELQNTFKANGIALQDQQEEVTE